MPLEMRKTSKWWYGRYKANGKVHCVNLQLAIEGRRPDSITGEGDRKFEWSRGKAQEKLNAMLTEVQEKRQAETYVQKLHEIRTGKKIHSVPLADLALEWDQAARKRKGSVRYVTQAHSLFTRFTAFVKATAPDVETLADVTTEIGGAFMQAERARGVSGRTCNSALILLRSAFKVLAIRANIARNPFEGITTLDEDTTFRKPFTPEELQVLLTAAKDDEFMYPLIVTAACTGMRRGDVCELKWPDVDLKAGMLTVKTSKTGGNVEIPIFAPLQAVLTGLGKPGKGYVYPEAAAMLKDNANGLSWRFKKIVAKAFDTADGEAVPCPPAEILDEGLTAIREHVSDETRRERMLEVLRLYCAGKSLRHVETTVGCARATVSADLHAVQDWIGKTFMRGGTDRTDVKSAMARSSRVEREGGQRAASVRDWHALRATWVTLALSAGVPVELVRRVTGHATVEVVLKHYFRPDREQFRAALTGALPEVLTGKAEIGKAESRNGEGETADRRLKTADQKAGGGDLVALAGKVAAGVATKAETARFKKLAAGV